MGKKFRLQTGQSMVTLVVFTMIFISIFTMSITMILVNSVATDEFQQSITARQIAESGAEEALLRLLRNPNYSGEILTVGNGTATISITGDAYNKTITSVGTLGKFQKKINVVITYNDIMSILSWQEES